ncbi:MAG: NAD(P)/FAD-dependent oxidoreductase [Spirochaetales bacterium]|nr:NAD(P)/FAD-dependent oxidoreductase [Spirochaetales bacterium]
MSEKTVYDVIICGAGMAGLTAAAYAGRAGKKVLVLEKNEYCGGLVNSFKRDGFLFDAGLRALEDAGIISPMLHDLGINMEMMRSFVSIGIENKIIKIETGDDIFRYKKLLECFYPAEKDNIAQIINIIKNIMKDMDILYGIENPFFKNIVSDLHYTLKVLLPWFFKFIFTYRKINLLNGPVENFIDTITGNRSLRDIICQHFFKNTPAFFALSYFSLYLDYQYPRGGTGRLATCLEKKARQFGVEIKIKTAVREVRPDGKKVKDHNGNIYFYKKLIWAADLKYFYAIVKTENLPVKVRNGVLKQAEKINSKRGGDSVFTLFLETGVEPEQLAGISHGHFFYTPSSRGLNGILDDRLPEILKGWPTISRSVFLQWLKDFCYYTTYEISVPVLKDEDAAPAGKSGIIVSLLFSYDLCFLIKTDGWYEEFKKEMQENIINVLNDTVFPFLRDNIIKAFSYTPLSIQRIAGASDGALTGWSFERPVPAVNKMLQAKKAVLTPVPDIYQAGQWTYSPGGVPMAILTGKIASDAVLKGLKKNK